METNTNVMKIQHKQDVLKRTLHSISELCTTFDDIKVSEMELLEFKETLVGYIVELMVDYKKSISDPDSFFNWCIERLEDDIINDSIFTESEKNFDLLAALLKAVLCVMFCRELPYDKLCQQMDMSVFQFN